MSRLLPSLLLWTALFLLSGCGTVASKSESPPTEAAAEMPITVRQADEKELAALIEKNKGKVVFVDYWATFCKPCIKNFPHTVQLHNKYADQGLVVVSMDFDALDAEDKVLQFLKENGATFENLISKYDGAGTEANEASGIEALPQLRLYDRKGELRHKWEGNTDDLDAKIKELIEEKA